jgi:beta-phosphoglucomutase-like phosphatase (HAD superfamily)
MIGPAYMWFGELSDSQWELIKAHTDLVTKARSLWDASQVIMMRRDRHEHDDEALAAIARELDPMINGIRSLVEQLRANGIGISKPPWERDG